MTRRVHYINVRFYEGKPSAIHWSPYRECWPNDVVATVEELRTRMAAAFKNGKVSDGASPASPDAGDNDASSGRAKASSQPEGIGNQSVPSGGGARPDYVLSRKATCDTYGHDWMVDTDGADICGRCGINKPVEGR